MTVPEERLGGATTQIGVGPVQVIFEDDVYEIHAGQSFDIGRDADLCLGDNPYLHRRFLRIIQDRDFWWLVNMGKATTATVYDPRTGAQAWLEPTSRIPLIFGRVDVVFTAGPCTYRLEIRNEEPIWRDNVIVGQTDGDTTISALTWTSAQKLAIVALAEPMLVRTSMGMVQIPSNMEASQRIGWSIKRFEKKIDNICAKLDRLGVEGMRGGLKEHATGRRVRLVEWAVSTGLVTPSDIDLLHHPDAIADDEGAGAD